MIPKILYVSSIGSTVTAEARNLRLVYCICIGGGVLIT